AVGMARPQDRGLVTDVEDQIAEAVGGDAEGQEKAPDEGVLARRSVRALVAEHGEQRVGGGRCDVRAHGAPASAAAGATGWAVTTVAGVSGRSPGSPCSSKYSSSHVSPFRSVTLVKPRAS